MEWPGELWRRLLYPLRKRQIDRDLEDEMRFHLEMKAAESGAAPARLKFGNVALWLEDSRQAWGWAGVEAWAADVKYALRALAKNPGFTAVAVLTMALGIGASTAVFSVVNAVLLRPLPFREPGRIMMIWENWQNHGGMERMVVSHPDFTDWKAASRSFEHMAIIGGGGARWWVGDEPVLLPGASVSGDFFPALGAQPILGRGFLPDEERASTPQVTVLSYGLWQRLGGDRRIVGRAVRFDRDTFTVVGVMPRGFDFPDNSELWFPFTAEQDRHRGNHSYRVIGRLKAGVTVEQAQREIQTIAARLAREYPAENGSIGANVVPLLEQTVGEARRALLVLLGAVGAVLLIACANVANLLLVRITGRRRELALRLALGAGRWRVARCLLTESVLLALTGGALGVAAAYWLVRAFVALDPIQLPRIHEVALDGGVLLCALTASIATGLLFGLAPALRASRPDLANWLKEGPGAAGGGEFAGSRVRGWLAASQIALAVMLLIGAGLLLRSFVARVSVPLGFRPEGVIAADLPWSVRKNIGELLVRLRALPGVEAAGAATAFPLDPAATTCGGCLEIEGQPKEPGKPSGNTGHMVATADYFRAAGMSLKRGRFFTAADGKDAPKVAVINQALARREFGDRDPIGAHVRWGTPDWSTVVGVAGDVKGFGVAGDPIPTVYFARGQVDWLNGVEVLVRTAVPPLSLAGAVRKEMRAWNQRMIIGKFGTLDSLLADSVVVPRFYMLLVVGFAALALAVSAVGVYGTVNYSVARRTHEIGIRMALGADRGDVVAMVLGQGLRLAAVGVVVGLGGAWVSTRVLETLLFGVQPTDGVAFAAGTGVLALAVLLACYIPARRATRVDPLVALRHE